MTVLIAPASFAGHVSNIVAISSEEKMVDVDTRWVVTGMADQHVGRSRLTHGALPSVDVSFVGDRVSLSAEDAVAILIAVTQPDVTNVRRHTSRHRNQKRLFLRPIPSLSRAFPRTEAALTPRKGVEQRAAHLATSLRCGGLLARSKASIDRQFPLRSQHYACSLARRG